MYKINKYLVDSIQNTGRITIINIRTIRINLIM